MGIGIRIVEAIQRRSERNRKKLLGPLGDFYRNGGNHQLYEVPVDTNDLIIDAGGYFGEWTAKMLVCYGCRSEIFEPAPEFADKCKGMFAHNTRVRVHTTALGGSTRTSQFSLSADGTSEFLPNTWHQEDSTTFDSEVLDVGAYIRSLAEHDIACIKLNIEGGEYEVLERLIETKQIVRCRSLLIQFHQQPDGWEARRQVIINRLRQTHDQAWSYPMVWEKWVKRDLQRTRCNPPSAPPNPLIHC